MKTKLKIVNYSGGLDTWLNFIRKDNWHFFKMEPYLQNVVTQCTIETGKFLASAKYDPVKASLYHSKFIGNASGNSKFNFERMDDMNGKLSKCGFDLLDYKPVFYLRREDGNWIGPPMDGYLCLWGITFDSAKAANITKLAELVWDRLNKDEAGIPESVNTPDEFICIVKKIVKLEKEVRQEQMAGNSLEAMEADADEISEALSYSNSKEFVEEILWHIEGSLNCKSLARC